MASIYEVRAQHEDRVISFGARKTRAEAVTLLAESRERVARVGGANDRYWIEEIPTEGLFDVPSLPAPRDRFSTRVTPVTHAQGWQTVEVDVLDGEEVVATYARNYAMLDTFEAFRQGDRHFALVSPDYTATSVLDLESGQIIASEDPSATGFCPVGFYVPDWWDVHDGRRLPGEMSWSADSEWPSAGTYGFVWGCIWGDDSSWKVQYLDLSKIQDGILRREERFGYLKLASRPSTPAREFIRCRSSDGRLEVDFVVEQTHDLETGQRLDLDPFD